MRKSSLDTLGPGAHFSYFRWRLGFWGCLGFWSFGFWSSYRSVSKVVKGSGTRALSVSVENSKRDCPEQERGKSPASFWLWWLEAYVECRVSLRHSTSSGGRVYCTFIMPVAQVPVLTQLRLNTLEDLIRVGRDLLGFRRRSIPTCTRLPLPCSLPAKGVAVYNLVV